MNDNLPEKMNASNLFEIQEKEEESSALKEMSASDWIPRLSIGYATSDSVKHGKANLGDFVLSNETSLGNKIKVVILSYRVHAAVVDKKKNNIDSHFYISRDYKEPLALHEEFQAFMNQPVGLGKEVQEGIDLFMYLPEHNSFAQLWCKKTLKRSANTCFAASRGGRVIEIATVMRENRARTRSWFELSTAQTGECVSGRGETTGLKETVTIPNDLLLKYMNQFENPPKEEGEFVDEDAAPERER